MPQVDCFGVEILYSTATNGRMWGEGRARSIVTGQTDPHDANFHLHGKNGALVIDRMSGNTPRMYV